MQKRAEGELNDEDDEQEQREDGELTCQSCHVHLCFCLSIYPSVRLHYGQVKAFRY